LEISPATGESGWGQKSNALYSPSEKRLPNPKKNIDIDYANSYTIRVARSDFSEMEWNKSLLN